MKPEPAESLQCKCGAPGEVSKVEGASVILLSIDPALDRHLHEVWVIWGH